MRRLTVAFLGLLMLLVVVCVFLYLQATRLQQDYSTTVLRDHKRLELVNRLYSNKELKQNLLRLYQDATDTSTKDKLRRDFKQARNANAATLRELSTYLNTTKQAILADSLLQQHQRYTIYTDSLLALSELHRPAEAQAYTRHYLVPFYHRHQANLLKLGNAVSTSSERTSTGVVAMFSSIVSRCAILLLIAIAVAIWVTFTLNKVFRYLNRENNILNAEVMERKQLQHALLESQQQLKRIFNSNPVPMWVYDQHSLKFMQVNQAAVQEYGYSREEFLQMTLQDIRAETETAAFLQRMQTIDKSADGSSKGFRHQRKDGSQFIVELRSHALPEQDDLYPRLVVAVNVQEREQAITDLQKSEQQLREISSSIPGAVYQFLIDAEQQISFPFVSDGIKDLYGVTPADVYTSPQALYRHIHPEDQELIRSTTATASSTITPWLVEYRMWQPERSTWKWVRGHGLPTAKQDGTILFNGTLIDITEQKEAQEKLLQSEANLRALLNSSPQAIFLLDKNLEVLSYNAVAAADVKRCLLKRLRRGQCILDFVDAQLRQQVLDNHSKAMQGHATLYEAGMGAYWHEVAFRPVLAADNSVLAVALTIHNISEQKNAIATIKQSEAQLARAQQLAQLGNWEYDIQKDLLTWSDGVYAIFKVSRDSFVPSLHSIKQFAHPDAREHLIKKYSKAVRQKSGLALDHHVILADGSERFLHEVGEVICDEDGVPVKLSGSVQDITERVQVAREATEAKNLLQSTLENIPEIIFSTNPSLQLTYVSPQCREITGYTEQEFVEKQHLWDELLLPEDRRYVVRNLLPSLFAGNRQQYESRIITKSGETRWLLLRLSPLLDETGKLQRIDGSASDITNDKAEEVKRNELTEQLLNQNQNLQQFAYIVSHNLRAPIANILGLTSIYNSAQPEAPVNQRVVDKLIKSAQLLDSTIRDLNEILTMRSQLQQEQEEVCLEEILQLVLESMPEVKAAAEIRYNFEAAQRISTVRSYMQSIITNLISNAYKYKASDRKLHLTLNTSKHSNYICLSVSDNGLGLDLPRLKDKMFGLYKRFHPNIEGRGLGLHLVKTQAELLNGKVEVESQLGVGTTFNIYFRG
ncbi:PAS domain S-box protein [Pontibacter chitinilyticus]|uniref:PAS domain S-box protein n=1 Tax=Pontibacter chitinilyticus TaxID=2674989 RepID=UPI00321C0037